MSRKNRVQRSNNRGWFRRGEDPRRHHLTAEERSRGGTTSWKRTMAELRLSMNLPLPTEAIREQARKILAERRVNRK